MNWSVKVQCGAQTMSAACVVPVCRGLWPRQSVSSEATRPAVCYEHPSVCAGWLNPLLCTGLVYAASACTHSAVGR